MRQECVLPHTESHVISSTSHCITCHLPSFILHNDYTKITIKVHNLNWWTQRLKASQSGESGNTSPSPPDSSSRRPYSWLLSFLITPPNHKQPPNFSFCLSIFLSQQALPLDALSLQRNDGRKTNKHREKKTTLLKYLGDARRNALDGQMGW